MFSGVVSKLGFAGLPFQVRILILLSLLFSLGRNLAFPYLAMYLTGKAADGGLEIDASLVGFMIMVGGFAYIFPLLFTGSLCDRFGRRKMMCLFVVSQIFLTAGYAFATSITEFFALYVAINIIGAFYDPAYSAMVADLVQPNRREEVYGLSYMIANIGTVVSPVVGGIIAITNGFSVLFIYATVFMTVGAVIVLAFVRESLHTGESPRSVTLSQFVGVFRHRLFILFCLLGALTNVVYSQLYGLLSVYTTKYVGLPSYFFGILFSVNGIMVVSMQIPVRKAAVKVGSTKAFIVAQLFYAVGFTYFLLSRDFVQFLTGVVVLTFGEIIFVPAISGFVADLSPVDMRGRYSALAGLFFGIGGSVGSLIGFRLYDVLPNKELIWAVLGAIAFATLPGYLYLLKAQEQQTNIRKSKFDHKADRMSNFKKGQ